MTEPTGPEPSFPPDPRSLVEAIHQLVPGTSTVGPDDVSDELLARAAAARKAVAFETHEQWHRNAIATGFLVIEMQARGMSAFDIRVATGISERTQGRRADLARRAARGENTRDGEFDES